MNLQEVNRHCSRLYRRLRRIIGNPPDGGEAVTEEQLTGETKALLLAAAVFVVARDEIEGPDEMVDSVAEAGMDAMRRQLESWKRRN